MAKANTNNAAHSAFLPTNFYLQMAIFLANSSAVSPIRINIIHIFMSLFLSYFSVGYARKVMTRLTIISFSVGFDSAIITVKVTSVWSAIRLEPSLRSRRSLLTA